MQISDWSVSYSDMSESGISEERAPKFRRRAAARPDEVLDAALALFSAKGFAQTSVEAVARAAGLSKAAVYLYFPSKNALLAVPALVMREAAVVPEIAEVYREEVMDRVLPALRQIIARGVASGQLRAVDPDLTVRSIVGAVLAHVVLAQVFGIQPAGGLELEALVENHISILQAGLRA